MLLSHGGISNEEAKIKDGQATQKVEVRNTSVTKISTKDDKDIQLDTENNKEKSKSVSMEKKKKKKELTENEKKIQKLKNQLKDY